MKAILILFTVLAMSCAKEGPPPEPNGSTETPAEPTDPSAEPAPPAGTPTACKADADCVVSCARAANCCDQLCEPCQQPFHKTDLAALETWRSESCAAASCPVAKCRPPTEEAYAVCEAGACVAKLRPMK